MSAEPVVFHVKDYSETPSEKAGSYPESVRLFQEELLTRLENTVKQSGTLIVDVSDTYGYSGSFLDDVFLNLQDKFNARAALGGKKVDIADYLILAPRYSMVADLIRDRMKLEVV